MKISRSNGAHAVAVGRHERLRLDTPRLEGEAPTVKASAAGDGWTLTDLAGSPRDVRIVFDDGSSRLVHLDGTKRLEP